MNVQPMNVQPMNHVHSQPAYAQPAYAQPAYAQPAYAQPAYAQPMNHVHSPTAYVRRPATVSYADIVRQDDVQQYIQAKAKPAIYKAIADDGSEWTNTNRERLESDVRLINKALAQAGERVPITITVPK